MFKSLALFTALTLTLSACSDGKPPHDMSAKPQMSHDDMNHDDTAKVDTKNEGMAHEGVMALNAVIRAPLPGRTTAMGTMVLMNHTDVDDVLISVSAGISDTVEIHTMLNEDGIMKMRRLENGIKLPAGSTAQLKGGADHLMIFNAVIPDGAKTAPLTLVFEKAGTVTVEALIDDGTLETSGDAMDHSAH